MVRSFKPSEQLNSECDFLRRTEHLLKLNGLETTELIHEVNNASSNRRNVINEYPILLGAFRFMEKTINN